MDTGERSTFGASNWSILTNILCTFLILNDMLIFKYVNIKNKMLSLYIHGAWRLYKHCRKKIFNTLAQLIILFPYYSCNLHIRMKTQETS